ncbi:MAG: hypothetical protein OXG39_15825 [Chloroflexi bacterium]|nr:hypothetical protein [Chloroflexota bacterium]
METGDDELLGAVAKSVQHEGLFAHYLDDPIAYLKHFASYGWNAKSDGLAEESFRNIWKLAVDK